MKKVKLFGLLLITLVFNACEFNKSVNKDLTTGAYSRGDGIGCDEIKIQINGKIENRNKFIYGEKLNIIFNNISGLTKENGNVFPGLSMFIIKNKIDTVLQHQDLLSKMENGIDLSPLQLQANFITALTNKNNEKYQVYIKIWDKKGKGTFQYELPFSVKKSELLKINASNIDYTNIYLWDKTQKMVVINKEVSVKSTLMLILEGLNGLEIVDNKVYPSLSINITDQKGNQILSNPNILEQYKNEGVNYRAFKNGQIPVTITFTSGQINNPCQIKASLTDLNSERRIDITGELEIK
ncbi:hypothetical protein [Carboxylicivirga taeanensis]|uniref:hypothetical protein n=1 Tax=Carboxylicivirga taeanensis TaxID=1416875 RepID=UPI003F6E1AC6